MERARQQIVRAVTDVSGRHDEPELYAEPLGDPGLCGPGSLSWEIHGDVSATMIAGTAAITMELLHPSVMAGVSDLSSYRTNPLKRARRTAGYVIATTFAGTEAAERVIARVRRMHEKVNGARPDGTPYSATDPVLLGWVHTSIPWFVMKTFERTTGPLSPGERNRYLAEQAVIGRKGGAGEIPDDDGRARRVRGGDAPAPLRHRADPGVLRLPDRQHRGARPARAVAAPVEPVRGPRLDEPAAAVGARAHGLRALRPRHADRVRALSAPDRRTLRWAFGVPPYRAMAEARMEGSASIAGRARPVSRPS